MSGPGLTASGSFAAVYKHECRNYFPGANSDTHIELLFLAEAAHIRTVLVVAELGSIYIVITVKRRRLLHAHVRDRSLGLEDIGLVARHTGHCTPKQEIKWSRPAASLNQGREG